ncbi:uncharacterized protein [Prorops nasuta]|uniref:uncharacterized protein n=1 Tax=Prorops nasuta TaxID=863751 RepID=UPI0034CF4D8A
MASSGELLEIINYVPMIRDEFVRLVVNIKKRVVHNFTLPFLEDRLAAVEKWLKVLHKTHVKITTHTKPAELAKMEYVTDSWYQAALDAHSDAEEFILGHLDELRSNQVMSASGPTASSGEINHIRLPVIDLPKFSGDYLEWNNFYETFSSIVHDKVYVSGRDKFHYLKSCLQGEAATVIKSLAITSENYEIAWDTLVARYTDKRMITDTFLDQISQVPTLRGDNFKVLKEVRDSVTVALNALKTMGYGVDQWDPIIVHSLKNKLDDTLRLAWEMYLGSSKDYPTFIQFSEFLTRHINSLQSLGNKPKTSKKESGISLKSHATSARGTTPAVNSSSEPEPSSSNTTTRLSVSDTRSVLLATFVARIDAHDGSRIIVRGLVDTGSETSFISENLAQQLRVSRKRVNATIHGVALNSAQNVRAEVQITLHSLSRHGVSLDITALILPRITQYMPPTYSPSSFPALNEIDLADNFASTRAPIDVLIGADYLAALMEGPYMHSPDHTLLAQWTIFGWIVAGVVPKTGRSHSVTVHHYFEVENTLRDFWELEEVPEVKPMSTEDSLSEKTLTRILQRLETSPEQAESYSQFLQEYQLLGHMSPVPMNSDFRVFLPHHAVFKIENQKTKIRVVFNASSKTSTGLSLNDTLFIGPKLQQDITRILMNWRAFRYVGVTDIVKMFRQILVRFEDRKYQNILWKTDSGELQAFELNTLTYGTGPAPFLSLRVMRELASTDGADFPLAQDVLLNSSYVDDILFGAHDLKQLKNAKIFDPLGWISPIVITLKQLMQCTWLLKLSWDEEIPEPIQSKWLKCYEQLCDLQALSIPRWTRQSLTTRKRELIGFCDASELAYDLVISKTKVTPIKTTSIPRLGLVAAALLVKLLVHVKASLVGNCDAIRCYSDSQVALAWIAKQPVHWKTFVANRVSYVQTHLPEASWHYVPTKLNPADLCSRGTSVFETAEESRKVALTAQLDTTKCWFFDKFSSWSKLVRVMAYVLRFVQRTRKTGQWEDSLLSASEIRDSIVAIVQFWVMNARNLVKSCIHKCITCVRERAKLGSQLMGSLPASRVSRSFTFEHTGVDYAGPFLVKLHHGRNAKSIKCYVAVFVCLSTRAVHLELVSRLDTEAFLAALSRFISCRGKPAFMYSDNGLNFQGADAELKRAYKCALEAARTQKTDSLSEIEWKFIPVATPHWGGLWESAVKSMKHHLKRSIGVFVPNFEEMTTLLTKIEARLNSRPISRLHDDPESLDVLTPGHFLSGRALNSPPEFSTLDLRESSLNRWQNVIRITETFWKKWSSEYLHTLQNRPKWQNTNSEFGEGDLVLIKVPNNPPRMWTLGRILKLVPGVDGLLA